jgi:hypothetical protein
VGIFDRLGDVIRSYLNDEDGRIFGRPGGADPDIEDAEAELERFLRGESPRAKTGDWAGGRRNPGEDWSDAGTRSGDWGGTGGRAWNDAGTRNGDWGGTGGRRNPGEDWSDAGTRSGDWSGTGGRPQGDSRSGNRRGEGPPETLRPDFAELGLPFGAGADACKAAYRRLLKLHHPDRHASHQGNMEKATKKMAKINAAYDRIEKWRAGEKT